MAATAETFEVPAQKASLHEAARKRYRQKRMLFFQELAARVRKPAQILDVGGTVEFWKGQVPPGMSVTVVNLFEQAGAEGIRTLVGDGCNLQQFAENSFDITFSNSVLFLVGSAERQELMAKEIRRVGRRYFVQTANRNFFLDWRTLVPFFHWLSPGVQAWCFQRMAVGRYKRAASPEVAWDWATRVRDLTRRQLRQLFPEGTIKAERVLGLTKSFMVHHGFE
jgi:hypothetical protein